MVAVSVGALTIEDQDHGKTFELKKHVEYLQQRAESTDDYENITSDHLKMSGVYWMMTALELMKHPTVLSKTGVKEFLFQCYKEDGGFSPAIGHDSHILYTLSAVQVACLLEMEEELPANRIAEYICSLQQPDGSFFGDQWGEPDTRYSFCAVACLSLLDRLDYINVDKATEFVLSCSNFDDGFGSVPSGESHAGLVFCCIGFLSIVNRLNEINPDLLGTWLSNRQQDSGGFNGRPEKLPDVCYSWWVLASLHMIGRQTWIDKTMLRKFILEAQDTDAGGFSDRTGNIADPFHTLFGVAALSLMGFEDLLEVDPCYCLPKNVVSRVLNKRKSIDVS